MNTECKDCELSNGDCGHHFLFNGVVNYDIPSLSACDRYGNCWFFKPKEKPQGDLISREALKKACSEMVRGSNNSDFIPCPSWNNAMELIDNAPTFLSIPDNPTNGDMIKALFPNRADFNGGEGAYFNKDWWDAPYKEADNDRQRTRD